MMPDDQFIESLHQSKEFVQKAAEWLAGQGFEIFVRPTVVRPDWDSRHEFADNGDLEIRMRIEVKHRDLDFTCREDYPFDTVIVDEVFKVDRIPKNHLYGYVILNQACTHAGLIGGKTRPTWTTFEKYDNRISENRSFYVCPKEKVNFCRINP